MDNETYNQSDRYYVSYLCNAMSVPNYKTLLPGVEDGYTKCTKDVTGSIELLCLFVCFTVSLYLRMKKMKVCYIETQTEL